MDLVVVNYCIYFSRFLCVFIFLNGGNEENYKWRWFQLLLYIAKCLPRKHPDMPYCVNAKGLNIYLTSGIHGNLMWISQSFSFVMLSGRFPLGNLAFSNKLVKLQIYRLQFKYNSSSNERKFDLIYVHYLIN